MSQAVSFIVCPTFSFLTLFAPAGSLGKHFSFLSLQRAAKGAGPFKGSGWCVEEKESTKCSCQLLLVFLWGRDARSTSYLEVNFAANRSLNISH